MYIRYIHIMDVCFMNEQRHTATYIFSSLLLTSLSSSIIWGVGWKAGPFRMAICSRRSRALRDMAPRWQSLKHRASEKREDLREAEEVLVLCSFCWGDARHVYTYIQAARNEKKHR